MDSIEVRQRIAYLIEHGGLWEQARDKNNRMQLAIVALLIADIIVDLIRVVS